MGDNVKAPLELGSDENSRLPVLLFRGRHGYYVQLGHNSQAGDLKPKRVPWPKDTPIPASASSEALALALRLMSSSDRSPRSRRATADRRSGSHLGRSGRYAMANESRDARSAQKNDRGADSLGGHDSISVTDKPRDVRSGGQQLGLHPIDHRPVILVQGQQGYVVKHGKTEALVPTEMDVASVTLEQAVDLVAEKIAHSTFATTPTRVPSGSQQGHGLALGNQRKPAKVRARRGTEPRVGNARRKSAV